MSSKGLKYFVMIQGQLQNYEAGELGLSASVRAPLDTYNDSDMNDGCSK